MKEKIKNAFGFLVLTLASAMIGAFAVGLFAAIVDDNSPNFLVFIIFILSIPLSFLAQIFIHELGHLIFGLLAGFELVSFRVGSFILDRGQEGLKLKRSRVLGTLGQCLMMPKKEASIFSQLIYNLGGGLLNLLVSPLALIYVFKGSNELSKLVFLAFALMGILLALANLIPLKTGGLPNDGHNVLSIIRDPRYLDSVDQQLRINGLLSQGLRPRELEPGLFKLEPGVDLSSPLNAALIFYEHVYHLDRLDFQAAAKSLEKLDQVSEKLFEGYKNNYKLEKIFLELLEVGEPGLYYDKDFKAYIHKSKLDKGKNTNPSLERLALAYQAFYKENREKAQEHYDKLQELAETSPNRGAIKGELFIADYVKKIMDKQDLDLDG